MLILPRQRRRMPQSCGGTEWKPHTVTKRKDLLNYQRMVTEMAQRTDIGEMFSARQY